MKTNVEKIGGTVDVPVNFGPQGTTVRVKIPLTLAIIPALVCDLRGRALRHSPDESARTGCGLKADDVVKSVEVGFTAAPVYRLRGQLLPLVYLNRELKLADE